MRSRPTPLTPNVPFASYRAGAHVRARPRPQVSEHQARCDDARSRVALIWRFRARRHICDRVDRSPPLVPDTWRPHNSAPPSSSSSTCWRVQISPLTNGSMPSPRSNQVAQNPGKQTARQDQSGFRRCCSRGRPRREKNNSLSPLRFLDRFDFVGRPVEDFPDLPDLLRCPR